MSWAVGEGRLGFSKVDPVSRGRAGPEANRTRTFMTCRSPGATDVTVKALKLLIVPNQQEGI